MKGFAGRRSTGRERSTGFEASGAPPRSRIARQVGVGSSRSRGLALLRLAEGNRDASASAMRRALDEASRVQARAALLPTYVEIMLAAGEVEEARSACRELENISRAHESDMLRAMSAQAHGALALAEGKSDRALAAFREALRAWQELEAPYEVARVRVLVGLGYRAIGDEDAADRKSTRLNSSHALLSRMPSSA